MKVVCGIAAFLLGVVPCGRAAFAEGVDLKVEFREKGSWKHELVRGTEDGREVFTIRLKADAPEGSRRLREPYGVNQEPDGSH